MHNTRKDSISSIPYDSQSYIHHCLLKILYEHYRFPTQDRFIWGVIWKEAPEPIKQASWFEIILEKTNYMSPTLALEFLGSVDWEVCSPFSFSFLDFRNLQSFLICPSLLQCWQRPLFPSFQGTFPLIWILIIYVFFFAKNDLLQPVHDLLYKQRFSTSFRRQQRPYDIHKLWISGCVAYGHNKIILWICKVT